MRLIGESYALVSIGLMSFVAAAQFFPSIIGGMLWKGATRLRALAGLSAGFLVWIYMLLLPSFARSGWLSERFLHDGPWGFKLLGPYALFGLEGLDPIAHALFWTLVFNVGLYVVVSLVTTQSMIERSQAVQFVDIFKRTSEGARIWRGKATIGDLRRLMNRFMGEGPTYQALRRFERDKGRRLDDAHAADADTVHYAGAATRRHHRRGFGADHGSRRCCGRRCTTSTRSCRFSTRPPSSWSIAANSRRNRSSLRPCGLMQNSRQKSLTGT